MTYDLLKPKSGADRVADWPSRMRSKLIRYNLHAVRGQDLKLPYEFLIRGFASVLRAIDAKILLWDLLTVCQMS
jgi:hypothetical protein